MAPTPADSTLLPVAGTRQAHPPARKANVVRITALSMLAYAIVSGLISLVGTLATPLAQHFGVSVPAAASRFGYLSSGIAFGSILGLVFFERCDLRRAFMLCQGAVFLSLGLLMVLDRWALLPALLFGAGAAAGLGLCAGAVCLSLLYAGRQRAAMLLSTDICFATAGIVLSPVAARLIDGGARWDSAYLLLAAVAAAIALAAALSRFPPTAREAQLPPAPSSRLPPAVAFCGAGLLCYLLGQVSMLVWVPNYLQAEGGADLGGGAAGISRYWTGMALGQLATVLLLARFRTAQLLGAAIAASCLCALPLAFPREGVSSVLLALGLCNACILKLTLAFAADLVAHPQRVITALLCCGSLGQAVAPFASAALVEAGGMRLGLQLTPLCYLLAAMFIGFAIARHGAAREDAS